MHLSLFFLKWHNAVCLSFFFCYDTISVDIKTAKNLNETGELFRIDNSISVHIEVRKP